MIEGDGHAIISAPLSPTDNDNHKSPAKTTLNDRRRIFKQIIVKCVLQLQLTTNDLLPNDEVYHTIPPEHLLRLTDMLDHSYQFAPILTCAPRVPHRSVCDKQASQGMISGDFRLVGMYVPPRWGEVDRYSLAVAFGGAAMSPPLCDSICLSKSDAGSIVLVGLLRAGYMVKLTGYTRISRRHTLFNDMYGRLLQ
jgi:hypothetical protein